MTEAAITLAREAVACKHWEWMPRMVDQLGRTVLAVRDGMCLCAWWTGPAGAEQPASGWVRIKQMGAPDFNDPATVGCLLALVREAWPAACPAHAARGDSGIWRVWIGERVGAHALHHHTIGTGPTEAAALVAALKAAP